MSKNTEYSAYSLKHPRPLQDIPTTDAAQQHLQLILQGLPTEVRILMWQHIQHAVGPVKEDISQDTLLQIQTSKGSSQQSIVGSTPYNFQCNCACTLADGMDKGTVTISELVQMSFRALLDNMSGLSPVDVVTIYLAALRDLTAANVEQQQEDTFSISQLGIIVSNS